MESTDTYEVKQRRVDEHFAHLKHFLSNAALNDIAHVEALVERIRIELILQPVSARRKRLYRAAIDYLEDIVEERHAKENHDRAKIREAVRQYVKTLLDALTA